MPVRRNKTTRNRRMVITTHDGIKFAATTKAKKCIVKFCVKEPDGTETCNEVEVVCDPKLPFPKLRL